MSQVRICPNGHPLQETDAPAGRSTAAEVACPVCSSSGGPIPPPTAAPMPPPQVEGYELLGELGRGGMGVVYHARHRTLNRLVALKMIRDGALAGPEEAARFRAEAEAVARLQHPNVVQIHEVGECAGRPYLALEYLEGGSLARKAAGAPQPPTQAAALVETLARAVHAVHDKRVLHRDLKPANVLLTADGTPKITDFGLAKRLDAAGQTATGAVMGTPAYMAPEQARGDKGLTPAVDVYALGATLYELLTGRPPFLAATTLDTVLLVLNRDPVPPTQLQPKVPRDLESICLKCLAKEPGRRYPTAAALADDLRRFRDGRPTLARPVGRLARLLRWRRRNPVVAGLAAALTLLFVGAFAAVTVLWLYAAGQGKQASANAAKTREGLEALARSYTTVGDLYARYGQPREALRTLGDARGLLRDLNRQYPDSPALRTALAGVDNDLALASARWDRPDDALADFGAARDLWRGVLRDRPDDAAAGRGLADVCVNRAALLARRGRTDDALTDLNEAVARLEPLAARPPDDGPARLALAAALNTVGVLHAGADQPDDARTAFTRARGLLESAPDEPKRQAQLAAVWGNLGRLELKGSGAADAMKGADPASFTGLIRRFFGTDDRLAAARRAFETARDLRERLVREEGDSDQEAALAGDEVRLAVLRLAAGEKEEALRLDRRGLALLEKVRKANDGYAGDPAEAGETCFLGGAVLMLREQTEEAAAAFRQAVSQQKVRLDQTPKDRAARKELSRSCFHLAAMQRKLGRLPEAAATARERAALWADEPDEVYDAACELAMCASLAGEPAERKQYADGAMELLHTAFSEGLRDPGAVRADPNLQPLRDRPEFQRLLQDMEDREKALPRK